MSECDPGSRYQWLCLGRLCWVMTLCGQPGSVFVPPSFCGRGDEGLRQGRGRELTPCLMLGPSHCLLMVAVSSPSLCPYFQTDGRQRGRRATKQRAGRLEAGLLSGNFHIPILPPKSLQCSTYPYPFPTIQTENQDFPANQERSPPALPQTCCVTLSQILPFSGPVGVSSFKVLLPLCPGLSQALHSEGSARISEIYKAAGGTLSTGCFRVGPVASKIPTLAS